MRGRGKRERELRDRGRGKTSSEMRQMERGCGGEMMGGERKDGQGRV